MGKTFALLLMACLLMLSACSSGQTSVTEAPIPAATSEPTVPKDTEAAIVTIPPETTAETTAPTETAETTVPATEEETTEPTAAEETTPPTQPLAEDSRMPVLVPPEAEEGPCHFFDDAAFIGDSISYTLMLHNTKTGDFGEALFFVRGSLGIHNTLNRVLKIYYQGQSMTPWDALAASGVNKVFIMMGTNDIGYYGIDATMEKWEEFLGNIRQSAPEIQVYIQSLTPMWTESEVGILNNENIDLYNQRLKEFAEANDCYFVDIAPYFKDQTNGMARPYCNDFYVHMNYDGTAVWANLLKDYGAQQEKENP